MKTRSSIPNKVQGNDKPFKFNKYKSNRKYINTPKKRVKMAETKSIQTQKPTNNNTFNFTPFILFAVGWFLYDLIKYLQR